MGTDDVEMEVQSESPKAASSRLDRRNPMSYFGISLKAKAHAVGQSLQGKGKKKRNKDEPLFVPRSTGWGSVVDFAIGVKMIFLGNPITLLCLVIPFAVLYNRFFF